jgi:hypothetical protein
MQIPSNTVAVYANETHKNCNFHRSIDESNLCIIITQFFLVFPLRNGKKMSSDSARGENSQRNENCVMGKLLGAFSSHELFMNLKN